jgi:uncharacterized membrane protein
VLIMGQTEICDGLSPVLRIVGIVVWGIRVVVPIILIVVGMIDLAKAVTEKSEEKIKEAQQKLVKRAIAAVLVFLVVSLVTVVMSIVGNKDYEACMDCIESPWSCSTTP